MPLLRDAGKLYVGTSEVLRAYVGSTLVWQPAGTVPTPDITNVRTAFAQIEGANAVTVPRPAGSLTNDVALVNMFYSSDRTAPGAPSGWSVLADVPAAGTDAMARLRVFGKVIGSETGWSFTGSAGNNNFLVITGTGISLSPVFDITPQAVAGVTTPAGVTPTVNNGLAVALFGAQGGATAGSTTLWTPQGTNDGSVQISGEWNSSLLVYRKLATPSEFQRTATPPGGSVAGSRRAISYVIRPA